MSDQTISFLKNPYGFISHEARKRRCPVFETRLLLRKTICMTGAEAAEIFYSDYFMRKGAAPSPVTATLFGRGGLQGMDGVAHRKRKDMLTALVSGERAVNLGMLVRETLRLEAVRWSLRNEVLLYEELQKVLTEAVCKWAGIPMDSENIAERAEDIAAQYDRAGGKGNFSARFHRGKAEAWLASLIQDVRNGQLIPEHGSALSVISGFKDHRSTLLDEKTAAVELLNILRPTIATSVYMVFVAHALSQFPESRPDLRSEQSVINFLQEIRRHYPFFPAISAKVKKPFRWKGLIFRKGERVLLDIFGTNHDHRIWHKPEEFNPDRFNDELPHPYAFIPQGGGNIEKGHRCPGEELCLELMRQALYFFMEDMDYTVPAQDLMIDFSRMPALPKSHFKISVVKLHYLRSVPGDQGSYYNDNSWSFSHL